jgi:quinol monooxygenase YgiN
MNNPSSLMIERIVARDTQVDALKVWLQVMAEHIRLIPGVHQLELFQNQEKPTEFVFFLIVDDLPAVSEVLDQAEWHEQFVQELPTLTVGDPERVIGIKIA